MVYLNPTGKKLKYDGNYNKFPKENNEKGQTEGSQVTEKVLAVGREL